MNFASIIVEMDSQEYSVYFRTIRRRVDGLVPIENVFEGRHFFTAGFLRGGYYGSG